MEVMTSLVGKEIYFYLYFCSPHFCKIGNLKDKQGFFFCEKWAEYKQCQGSYFLEEKKKITSSSVACTVMTKKYET